MTGERHNELVARGDMVSVNGRWYVAVDAVDAASAATGDRRPTFDDRPPTIDREPAPESDALKERRHGRKVDLEGAAGPS